MGSSALSTQSHSKGDAVRQLATAPLGGDDLGRVTKEALAKATAPLFERLATLEQRNAELLRRLELLEQQQRRAAKSASLIDWPSAKAARSA